MNKVTLENIKCVKKMEFNVPTQKGVYLLTGLNGTGKTSLLIALNRIGKSTAFSDYNCKNGSYDNYKNAMISYQIDTDKVTYKYTTQRWSPTPKSKAKIIDNFGFTKTKFISTSGMRFFQQVKVPEKIKTHSASIHLIDGLNDIFSTDKFNNLKFLTLGGKGKKTRKEKLYLRDSYSEVGFSFGERVVLNTLEAIEDVTSIGSSMLLIDEIELALHPLAQIKFYDYLKKTAQAHDVVVIIATHSSTLIKYANQNVFYLENNQGVISVHKDAKPAYILKSLTTLEDRVSDFVFLVEDEKAHLYLTSLVKEYQKNEDQFLHIRIISVGGWYETVKMISSLSSIPPYNKSQIQAFVDYDVKKTRDDLFAKPIEKQRNDDKKKIEIFNKERDHISYLDITPELGIYEWIKKDSSYFEKYLIDEYPSLPKSLSEIIKEVDSSEKEAFNDLWSDSKKRDFSKGWMKNFTERISIAECGNDSLIDKLYRLCFDAKAKEYLKDTVNKNKFKGTLKMIFNRSRK